MEQPRLQETLVEALERLPRPSLLTEDDVLFKHGLRPKEVVEIEGSAHPPSRSKILLDLISRCLLPNKYGSLHVGGLGCGVLLLDTDQRFDMFLLVAFMEARVMNILPDAQEEVVREIITSSLKILAIVQVFTHDDLALALRAARNYIAHHREVSLVVMDSICSHYWTAAASWKSGGTLRMNCYVDNVLHAVHKHLGCFEVSFVYTRSSHFRSRYDTQRNAAPHTGLRSVSRRVVVHQGNTDSSGKLYIYEGSRMHILFFEISSTSVLLSEG